jgi:Cu+-exporting ATPase
MNCGNCVRHVTEALQAVDGVASAVVSLEGSRATVRWKQGAAAQPAKLAQVVQEAGYSAHPIDPSKDGKAIESRAGGWRVALLAGVICTALLMAGEWVFGLESATWWPWVSLILASIVQFGPGLQFYRGAWNQLKIGASNMDTLVALGSTTAYAYSLWAMLSELGGHLYFMEAAAIITLISLGHWVEARVSERASKSLRALMNLAPATALRQTTAGEEEVPITALALNDMVVLKPGGRVATDGEVVEGQSAVDESMLTGESMPVEKELGTKVYAGTLNVNGRLLVRVTSLGEDTALAQVIAAVQRAQTSRANIQRLGDRVSNVFVPIVVLIALATGLWWALFPSQAHGFSEVLGNYLWRAHVHATPLAMALITASSVLIIACPCAMGLATPAAIMAGANAAARRGILIRDGVALEKAGNITAVLFDKTGTLTMGQAAVVEIEALDGATKAEAIRLAASLARHSQHPLSKAVAALDTEFVPLDQWQEHRGSGVQAIEKNGAGSSESVRLGSMAWLSASGVETALADDRFKKWGEQGATVLGLVRGKRFVAMFALADPVKAAARSVVQELEQRGMRVGLITGDHRMTALAIAQSVGIPVENVLAQVRPEDKAALVRRWQERGERVAFVGDGINDAPALEQADLGVAVSRASDVAREAADIVLLNSEIEAVPASLGLARATLRTIKQNLFWAFFYNALGVPLAALGFMSPILCAAAMGLSDLIVIGNALRLFRWKP